MKRMRIPTLILLTAAALACAQDQGDQPDVPGRAARLSFLSGSVSFQPGSVEDWVPATLNRPITTGDRLWTESGARAELNLGSAAFRLDGRTNFSFLNLDDRIAQVQVSTGTLSVRVRRLADDEAIEIDTPQAALSILRPGEYRVDVNEQGDATIATVRGGEMEASAGQAVTIHPREQVRIAGNSADGAQPVFDRRDVPPGDPFDNWCQERDRREDRSVSARYVSRDMPGYADLDDHGAWREYPDYGAVWIPAGVPVGWAPYRFGHWAWIAPWGWTWVDDAPWGYAPFHYGRWAFIAGSWGWIPGPVVVGVRPVYAPALVAWVGGPRFGVSIGIGGAAAVGWFPLGPREVFVPGYRYSPAYVERVNVTNTVIVNRTVIREVNVNNVTYVNRGVPGAVTAVSHETIVTGRPVGAVAMRVPPAAAQQAVVEQRAAAVPERAAVMGGRQPVRMAPPVSAMNRTVVTRAAPPAAPVAFERQRPMLEQNPGRPLARPAMTAEPAPQARPMYRQLPAQPPAQPRMEQTRPAPQAQPRPFDRPAERPERQIERPAPSQPRPVERPPDRPTERPMERPAAPAQRPEVREERREGKQPPRREEKREREKEKRDKSN